MPDTPTLLNNLFVHHSASDQRQAARSHKKVPWMNMLHLQKTYTPLYTDVEGAFYLLCQFHIGTEWDMGARFWMNICSTSTKGSDESMPMSLRVQAIMHASWVVVLKEEGKIDVDVAI
jgi:hypothetical protein